MNIETKNLSALFFLIFFFFSNYSVAQAPGKPTVTGDRFTCHGTGTKLTATGEASATFKWYDALTSGNLLGSTAALNSGNLTSNKHFYVEQTTTGGTSARTDVHVIVTPNPSFTLPTNVLATPTSNMPM